MRNVPVLGWASNTLALTLPMRPFTTGGRLVGGADEATSGAFAAFVIREDYIARLRLRFYESEWIGATGLRACLMACQGGRRVLTIKPDALAVTYSTYLIAPAFGQDVVPEDSGEFPGALETSIEVRTTNGAPFDLAYWP